MACATSKLPFECHLLLALQFEPFLLAAVVENPGRTVATNIVIRSASQHFLVDQGQGLWSSDALSLLSDDSSPLAVDDDCQDALSLSSALQDPLNLLVVVLFVLAPAVMVLMMWCRWLVCYCSVDVV